MVELWESEADKNNVKPLISGSFADLIRDAALQSPVSRKRYEFRPGSAVHEDMCPDLSAGFLLEVSFLEPTGADEGVICAQGDWNNGWAVYVNRPHLDIALTRVGVTEVVRIAVGAQRVRRLEIRVTTDDDGGVAVNSAADGVALGVGRFTRVFPTLWQYGGANLNIGWDDGLPVCREYTPPHAWSGRLVSVTVTPEFRHSDQPEAVVENLMHGD